jgi:hypothetical protein
VIDQGGNQTKVGKGYFMSRDSWSGRLYLRDGEDSWEYARREVGLGVLSRSVLLGDQPMREGGDAYDRGMQSFADYLDEVIPFDVHTFPGGKRTLAEWNEEDHPRADDGKFTDGSGGSASAAPKAKRRLRPGKYDGESFKIEERGGGRPSKEAIDAARPSFKLPQLREVGGYMEIDTGDIPGSVGLALALERDDFQESVARFAIERIWTMGKIPTKSDLSATIFASDKSGTKSRVEVVVQPDRSDFPSTEAYLANEKTALFSYAGDAFDEATILDSLRDRYDAAMGRVWDVFRDESSWEDATADLREVAAITILSDTWANTILYDDETVERLADPRDAGQIAEDKIDDALAMIRDSKAFDANDGLDLMKGRFATYATPPDDMIESAKALGKFTVGGEAYENATGIDVDSADFIANESIYRLREGIGDRPLTDPEKEAFHEGVAEGLEEAKEAREKLNSEIDDEAFNELPLLTSTDVGKRADDLMRLSPSPKDRAEIQRENGVRLAGNARAEEGIREFTSHWESCTALREADKKTDDELAKSNVAPWSGGNKWDAMALGMRAAQRAVRDSGQEAITLFRGLNNVDEETFFAFMDDEEVSFDQMASWTHDLNQGLGFVDDRYNDPRKQDLTPYRVLFQINGAHALETIDLSPHGFEEEAIVPRDTVIKITKRERAKSPMGRDFLYITADVVSQGGDHPNQILLPFHTKS